MAKLGFNLAGFSYQHGLSILVASYDAAIAGASLEVERARARARDYENYLSAGGRPIEERDDEGWLISSQEDVHRFEIEMAEFAASELRKAFVITAYHYWERTVISWAKGTRPRNHDDALKVLDGLGYEADPGLTEVLHMANVLKHNKAASGRWLLEYRREFFGEDFRERPHGRTLWAEALIVDDHAVRRTFEIIERSGPNADTPVRG